MTDWKCRDAECAESTYVGARRPCTAFLGRRVRKSHYCASIHRLIQWRVTELYGRNGVGGSKDAAKIVYSVSSDSFLTRVKVQRRWHMLPARRPCKALLGHRVREWNARNVIARSIDA